MNCRHTLISLLVLLSNLYIFLKNSFFTSNACASFWAIHCKCAPPHEIHSKQHCQALTSSALSLDAFFFGDIFDDNDNDDDDDDDDE